MDEKDIDSSDVKQLVPSVFPPLRDDSPNAENGGGEKEVDDAEKRTHDACEEEGEEDAAS